MPKAMKGYLEKHLWRCLNKGERDAYLRSTPNRTYLCVLHPRFIADFLGKKLPKEQDHDLTRFKQQSSNVSDLCPHLARTLGNGARGRLEGTGVYFPLQFDIPSCYQS